MEPLIPVKHSDLIRQIIEIELKMFLAVPAGPENSCQKNPEAFCLHRKVQFQPWSDKTLRSYLSDLESAQITGRNLMTQKYVMMEKPAHQSDPNPLLEKIVSCQLTWQREMLLKYPRFMSRARPLKTSGDSSAMTSFETYLRSELSTYSDKTLTLLYEDVTGKQETGVNMAEETYELLVQAAGYQSLEKAERV